MVAVRAKERMRMQRRRRAAVRPPDAVAFFLALLLRFAAAFSKGSFEVGRSWVCGS